ncbi:unnamed protein product [Paramecium primaurelia]|uniref:VLIG-type G domain-containing protein n=1 Tax=Paramecium primaurelia TaxID=5886 RepID=A0A8S1QV47_PARPR|nr:unnamed protein product [Paramecium primaurelia]
MSIWSKGLNGKHVIKYNNGNYYDGYFVNGNQHGEGQMIYTDEAEYYGSWINDKRQGLGNYKWANGDEYYGDWKNNNREGKGQMKYANGDLYYGEWKNDKREGAGIMKCANGELYYGDWQNDKREGNGIMKYWFGDYFYNGDFVNDEKHGKGREILDDEGYYEGDFVNDEWHGKGKFTWANGDYYYGDWKNNIRTGQGRFKESNGNEYDGDFVNGEQHGKGKYTWANGNYYYGVWKNNIRTGQGRFQSKNGYIFDQCPLDGCFSLEDFNISLTETSFQQQKKLVRDWMDNIKDTQKFKSLIPFFFNIIKRGESSIQLLSIIKQFNNQNRESINIISNRKALFQLFYNNSNDELQVMLLKHYQIMYPVPLIFQNPSLQTAKEEIDLYGFNEKLYYVFQTSFPIINFSLSQKQAQIGKTELINQLFYQQDKFETQDTCQLNNNTIDIMFDTQFNGSRNFSVADAHGQFPIELLVKILPLFRMWILQFDSEYELIENYRKLQEIKKSLPKQNSTICFIIRNYKGELEENIINEELKKNLEQLKKDGIKVHKIIDLAQKGLDKSLKEQELQLAQSFIFNEITKVNQQQSLVTNQDFLGIIQKFDSKEKNISHQFLQDRVIIKDLENELNRLVQTPLGFYDQEAFPIRSIEYQLKILKEKEIQLIQQKNNTSQIQTNNQKEFDKNQDNKEYEETKQQIIKLEDSIKNAELSNLLNMFCKIFDQSSYYILYLQFTDQVRKFNERNTYELQEKNQIINEKLMKLKKDRDQIKLKKNETNKEASSIINYDGKNKIYKKQQDELKQELKQNLENIAFRNIGIEMFWRELIAINQRSLANKQIDPADKVYEMIKKGEPFEFLDGDSLQINAKFLDELKNKFTNSGKEKVLVLSVLGPQSSGKSTILNKIFGCHFWTSVGRCTKGIYLNLLKIQFKEYFNNLFDYILILDSEGLQNPNQIDPEFDKKIALFVLAISDIILINVKGDINQQFKNLVEMSIFNLVSMKSNLSFIKQLSWCFNQNNDANNFAPFLNQIQGIANSLNQEYHNEQDATIQAIDYNGFLNISKENIQILGFANIEKLWRKNESLGIINDWRQLIINEKFSEEAYLFGIRIIENFVKKFQSQTDISQMQSLSLFIQNVNSNWQTICNQQDLLEFDELIQYKQDQLMKNKFEKIYDKYDFSFKYVIANEIIDRISSSPVKNSTFINSILVDTNEDLRIRFNQIEQDIQDKLLAFKQDQNIQKKIYLKYLKQLSQRINSSLKDSEKQKKNIDIVNPTLELIYIIQFYYNYQKYRKRVSKQKRSKDLYQLAQFKQMMVNQLQHLINYERRLQANQSKNKVKYQVILLNIFFIQ